MSCAIEYDSSVLCARSFDFVNPLNSGLQTELNSTLSRYHYYSNVCVDFQNVVNLWEWKTVQFVTNKLAHLLSGIPIMLLSRADFIFERLQAKQDHGQLAQMMSINGYRLI